MTNDLEEEKLPYSEFVKAIRPFFEDQALRIYLINKIPDRVLEILYREKIISNIEHEEELNSRIEQAYIKLIERFREFPGFFI